MRHLRFAIARLLVGANERQTVEHEAQALYAVVWPKHLDYRETTIQQYRDAILRARLSKGN